MENQKETVKKEDVLETENHIIAERLAKLDKLRAEGVAYPNDFVQKDRIEEVRAANGSKTPSGRNIITFSTIYALDCQVLPHVSNSCQSIPVLAPDSREKNA